MRHPKKTFELHPRLLDCQNSVPLANLQPKLDHPVNDNVGNANGLVLCIGGSNGVGELKKFFDGRKYGRDRVSRMVRRLLDNVLGIK